MPSAGVSYVVIDRSDAVNAGSDPNFSKMPPQIPSHRWYLYYVAVVFDDDVLADTHIDAAFEELPLLIDEHGFATNCVYVLYVFGIPRDVIPEQR
jgi:hypothetical protein